MNDNQVANKVIEVYLLPYVNGQPIYDVIEDLLKDHDEDYMLRWLTISTDTSPGKINLLKEELTKFLRQHPDIRQQLRHSMSEIEAYITDQDESIANDTTRIEGNINKGNITLTDIESQGNVAAAGVMDNIQITSRNSISEIKNELSKLEDMIKDVPTGDEETRKAIETLRHEQQAMQIELEKNNPDKSALQISAGNLKKAAQNIYHVMPEVMKTALIITGMIPFV